MKKSIKNSLKKQESKLVKYANKQGFKVVDGPESMVDWKPGYPANKPAKIAIQEGLSDLHRIYDLLHELGHHELRKNWQEFKAQYPATASAEYHWILNGIGKHRRRVAYMAERIREECDAWNIGLDIAHRKGLDISVTDYRMYSSKWLAQYTRLYGGRLARRTRNSENILSENQ